jgi:WD40 repeat protein
MVYSVAFSPDGKTFACGFYKGSLKLLDLETRAWGSTFEAHADILRAVEFSPDGKTLATASNDGTIKLWQTGTLSELITLRAPTSLSNAAFSPDGRHLVAACADGTIMRWRAEGDAQR